MGMFKKSIKMCGLFPFSRTQLFLELCIFVYFLTSSADLLHIVTGFYKIKPSHMAALSLFLMLILVRKFQIPKRFLFACGITLLSLCLSATQSVHLGRCAGYIGVWLFQLVCYFLVSFNLIQRFSQKTILKLYTLSFICVGLYATLQVVLSLFNIYDSWAWQRVRTLARGQAWTYEPSYYALYITAYVMYENAKVIFSISKKSSLWKIIGINLLLFVSTSTGIIFSYPTFFLLCFVMTWIKRKEMFAAMAWRRNLYFTLAFAGCLLVGSLSFWSFFKSTFYKFFYYGFMSHSSFTDRWTSLVLCFKVFLKHPILGVGLGGVGPYLYQQETPYPVSADTLHEMQMYDPMNILTEMLASLGVVGLLAFMVIGWRFYRVFYPILQHPNFSQEEKSHAIALFISLVMLIFVLQFNQGIFRPYVWIHAGIVYGIFHQLSQKASASFQLQERAEALLSQTQSQA